jgi:N-acyl-D-amino-acid deacylase
MPRRLRLVLVLPLLAFAVGHAQQPQVSHPPFDVVVVNGRVLDGAGNPWVRADLGIRDGRIAAIGRLQDAAAPRRIDAGGKYVAPGFIDVHTHAGEGLGRQGLEQARPLLAQGITTAVINPDGGGPIDLAAQRATFEAQGIGVNVAQLVGFGSVRRAVLGGADRAPTGEELARMKALVRTAMDQGAFGLSSGLFYAPQSFAATEEVIGLMEVVAEYAGVHSSHIRDEGDYGAGVVESVQEIVRIAEATRTRGIVSHMKSLGPDNWGLSVACTTRMDAARARGVEVFADQYPYEASSTSLVAALVPRWAQAGGEAEMRQRLVDPATREKLRAQLRENIRRRGGPGSLVVAHYAPDHALEGRSVADIAAARGLAPEDAVLDVISRANASIVSFNMSERDIEHIMRQTYTMSSSDGGLVLMTEGRPHPRNYGAFPRKLARYVRERGVVSLEFAVRSMTTLPALVFDLRDRGVIREGAWADLVVFDLEAVRDTATYTNPHQLAEGMSFVLVNGTVVVDDGAFTGARPGKVIRRGR